jgi:hypothetical protein
MAWGTLACPWAGTRFRVCFRVPSVIPRAPRVVPRASARGGMSAKRGHVWARRGYPTGATCGTTALGCVAGRMAWRLGSGSVCLSRSRVRSALEPVFDGARGVVRRRQRVVHR